MKVSGWGSGSVKMGGPGDLQLLYAAVKLKGAQRVVETVSPMAGPSLAILAAMQAAPVGVSSASTCLSKVEQRSLCGAPWCPLHAPELDHHSRPDRRGIEKALAAPRRQD